jgi:hypothetical protein
MSDISSQGMAQIPPPTFDPRQAKIYEQLERLGAAPVAYFADVCRLFQGLAPLESAGHIAGHLLRELKGSVKDVLYPDEAQDKKKKAAQPKGEHEKKDGDLNAIVTIAERYGLPADHEIIKLWPNLKLELLAHRHLLGSARQLAEVQQAWEELQIVLSELLDALDAAYTSIYERLDRLIAIEKPSRDDLDELLKKIPNNVHTLSYFFGRVQGRGWFDELLTSPLLDPPGPGTYWPQAPYLGRMAAEYPDDVAPILEKAAAVWNYQTQHHILETLPSLGVTAQGRILRVSATAVLTASGHDTYSALAIAKRAVALGHDETETAVEIVVSLLALRPDSDGPQGGYHGSRELVSPLEYYTYTEIVGEPVHALIERAPEVMFGRLLEILDTALSAVYAETKPDDVSKGWMPAIEPHGQNTHHYQPLPRLTEAIRDAAEQAVDGGAAELREVIDTLQAKQWQVCDRLALHLLGRFGDAKDPFVQQCAIDPAFFFEYDFRHEYGSFLRKVFPALPDDARATVLAWIHEGPRDIPDNLGEDDREHLRKSWTHLRLSWIAEHLQGDDAARLTELELEFGPKEESAEFSGYISGPFWGPTSPKTAEELEALSVPDLVAALKNWEPKGERAFARFAPTREGLARTLQPIVKRRAVEFAAASDAFIGLDATYVRALVAGLEDAVKGNAGLDWPAVLRLCGWAVAQKREIPGRDRKGFDSDPDWGWARAAIARLLRSGIRLQGEAKIPIEMRHAVWNVLQPITDDPDPDESRDTDERDPYSTAINSTRGVAMETLVTYAGWVRGAFKRPPEETAPFADMPEVEVVLNRHLDSAVDASAAVRAVYGESLFFLHILFPGWVEAHLDALFPANPSHLADAVLHTYLAWGHYTSKELNTLLTPQLARAIETFPARAEDEDKVAAYVGHVGARAVSMYLHGEGDLAEHGLVTRFFGCADEKTRARVVSLVPSLFRDWDVGDIAAARARAMEFWEWRLATSTDTDLRGFGQWMDSGDFDDAWRLAQLQTVLERIGAVDMDFQVVEKLGDLSEEFPTETLRCIRLLVDADQDMMKIHTLTYRGDVQRIIHAALTGSDDEAKKDATSFANQLIARGFRQFRAVLDPWYVPPPKEYD